MYLMCIIFPYARIDRDEETKKKRGSKSACAMIHMSCVFTHVYMYRHIYIDIQLYVNAHISIDI